MILWYLCAMSYNVSFLIYKFIDFSVLPFSFLIFLHFIFYYFFICSEFCHTLKWNSHGFTCAPHPDPPSHLPLHLLPLAFPSAPCQSAFCWWIWFMFMYFLHASQEPTFSIIDLCYCCHIFSIFFLFYSLWFFFQNWYWVLCLFFL